MTSNVAIQAIGERLKAYRVGASLSQDELATRAGISRRSITNLENGEDVKMSTVVKVLIALGLDTNIDLLVPDPLERPSKQFETTYTTAPRQRVRKKKTDRASVFKWGDETE